MVLVRMVPVLVRKRKRRFSMTKTKMDFTKAEREKSPWKNVNLPLLFIINNLQLESLVPHYICHFPAMECI